jgi:hypothetical protein
MRICRDHNSNLNLLRNCNLLGLIIVISTVEVIQWPQVGVSLLEDLLEE